MRVERKIKGKEIKRLFFLYIQSLKPIDGAVGYDVGSSETTSFH